MPDDRSAPVLIREVGLMADGPVPWGRPARHTGPGVFLVELPAPVAAPSLDLALVGKWLERVPELRMDGVRPASKDLLARLASFWLPSQPVLLVGSSTGSVGGRLSAMAKTAPGDRKPAWTGFWLHFLRSTADLRVWWAVTDDPELYEDALIDAFARGVPEAEGSALPGGAMPMPWAVLRTPAGIRKPTGIANPLVAEVKAPEPPPVQRIVDLPTAEADGARDEAKRGRRPAPGRGAGRVASAAAYAAQGSPRKAPEPVILSPEGRDRLQAELDGLTAQRPEVVKRIATAREHGDLKENAEYHAAREEQGFLEGRIRGRADGARCGRRARVAGQGQRGRRRVRAPGRLRGRGELARGPDLVDLAGGGGADGPPGRGRGHDPDPRRPGPLRDPRDLLSARAPVSERAGRAPWAGP
jgi:hypothetical protein